MPALWLNWGWDTTGGGGHISVSIGWLGKRHKILLHFERVYFGGSCKEKLGVGFKFQSAPKLPKLPPPTKSGCLARTGSATTAVPAGWQTPGGGGVRAGGKCWLVGVAFSRLPSGLQCPRHTYGGSGSGLLVAAEARLWARRPPRVAAAAFLLSPLPECCC